MAMRRICDLCGGDAMEKCYEFAVPAVLTNNSGIEFKAADSSMTDVCLKCITTRQGDVIARLLQKAEG